MPQRTAWINLHRQRCEAEAGVGFQQRQKIEPLVKTQRQPERHRRDVDAQSLSTTGPAIEPLPPRDAGQHHADGQRGHRKMHRRQAQQGQTEKKANPKQTMPAAGTATQCATPGCTMSNAAASAPIA